MASELARALRVLGPEQAKASHPTVSSQTSILRFQLSSTNLLLLRQNYTSTWDDTTLGGGRLLRIQPWDIGLIRSVRGLRCRGCRNRQGTVGGSHQSELFGAPVERHTDAHGIEIEIADTESVLGTIFRDPIAAVLRFMKQAEFVNPIELNNASELYFS